MLEQAAGLSGRALEAIAQLERQVVGADGGRLKLEWGRLRRRKGDRVDDLLWWEDGRLLGFLGLYDFGGSIELAGMVAPDARRRGIATRLLDAALPLCGARGHRHVLLIVPRGSAAGRALATARGGALEHSEHALVLSGPPICAVPDPAMSLRQATSADVPEMTRLLAAGFGGPAHDVLGRLETAEERTLVIERESAVVGTLRLTREGDEAGIYGFVVDPARQGRGIGRDALGRACEMARGEGAQRVRLEVAVDNDRALGLYTSVGFAPLTTEDYYQLSVS